LSEGGVVDSPVFSCRRLAIWVYCGGIVVSTMTCGMVAAVWMNQQEGRVLRVARDEGPTAGACRGVLGTLPGEDRRRDGKNGGSRATGLA
jgi:hypothetical protein